MFSKDWSRSSTLNGKKARPPVSWAKYLRTLFAVGLDAGDVGRDGIDHHVGLLRHFERLVAGVAALVIVAIADDYDGAAELVPRLVRESLSRQAK